MAVPGWHWATNCTGAASESRGILSLFISFEGTTGSGKTCQLSLLAQYLEEQGCDVLTAFEPGGTAIGDCVRGIVLDPQYSEMRPFTEALLFSASRAQLVAQVIRPHLNESGVVLCDRYADSTLAYQGYGHGLDLGILRQITALVTGGLVPDVTLYLDVPVQHGLRRKPIRAATQQPPGGEKGEQPLLWDGYDRLDMNLMEFHHRVRQGYLELAAAEPQRWIVINATQPVDEVQREVRTHISRRLTGKE